MPLQGATMPHICLETGTLTQDVKRELIKRLTAVSAEIMQIPAEYFFISIHELPNENIAIAGKDVNELRADFTAHRSPTP
ncbi:MAG: tautomerase family protein [Propionivibrio sp.]